MRSKIFVILSILVVLSMVLTACGAKATPTPSPAPTAAPAQAQPTAAPAPTEAPAPTAAPASTEAPAPTAAPAAKALKVGLVTDVGGVNDKSFNQSAWAGVQKAMADLGVEAKFIESKQPTDYEKNIDAFATEGYDTIVTVGFLMGDATAKKAKEYPNIKFAIIDNAYFPTKVRPPATIPSKTATPTVASPTSPA